MQTVLRICLLVALCLASGCGHRKGNDAGANPPSTDAPITHPRIAEQAGATSRGKAAEQPAANAPAPARPTVPPAIAGQAAPQSQPTTASPTASRDEVRAKAAAEAARLETQLAESNARIAESEARLAKMSERWLLLTESERDRLIRIKESLVAGKGIALAPSDFLFVYGSENDILVERELRAAAAVSCGPFIDYLAERLGWGPADRIVGLGVFARFFARKSFRQVPEEFAQGWYLQQTQMLYDLYGHEGQSTDDFEDDFTRLGVLAEVMHQRSRAFDRFGNCLLARVGHRCPSEVSRAWA